MESYNPFAEAIVRILKKVVMPALLFLAGLCAAAYALDDLWARYRGKPVVEVKVDRDFTTRDRWSPGEYSISTPETETSRICVQAMLPHFGYQPCWYLVKHAIPQAQNP
jgi:hypothetical protein